MQTTHLATQSQHHADYGTHTTERETHRELLVLQLLGHGLSSRPLSFTFGCPLKLFTRCERHTMRTTNESALETTNAAASHKSNGRRIYYGAQNSQGMTVAGRTNKREMLKQKTTHQQPLRNPQSQTTTTTTHTYPVVRSHLPLRP